MSHADLHACRLTVRSPQSRLRAALLPLCAVLLLAWAALPAAAQTGVIDANAKIHVTVANEPTLTGDYTVDGSGNITMLYINQVFVQGKTPAQAAATIRGAAGGPGRKATGLSQFYVKPQVVVTILDAGGIGVDVAGLVTSPRHYVVRTNAHLDDVLRQAVPALNADLSKVEITRGDTNGKETVDYKSFLDAQTPAGNPALHGGDVITVGSREAQPIFINVQGQVVKPGRFQVPASTTAYSALQAAGGPTLAANTTGIVIRHFGAAPTDTLPFQYATAGQNPTDATLNPVLVDGDSIIVPAATVAATYTLTGPGIRNPAEYGLTNGQPISLAAAIGKAGGLSDRAKINEVQIIRSNPRTGAAQTIKLNASDATVQGTYMVQAGDNITINQGGAPSRVDPFQLLGLAIAVFTIFRH
jgi:protein involved in polysaccharide export with SLBB domain